MTLTRRGFTSWLGLLAAGSAAPASWGALSESQASKSQSAQRSREGRDSRSSPEKPGGHSGQAAPMPHPAEHKVLTTPEEIWADLLDGNKRFVAGKPAPRELIRLREELAKGQHPQVIVLGCADSRVCPNLLFDKNLGDLFVVRTAGNVADPVALGSIEYAAEHLHAKVLLVLGHEKCGAVAAAAANGKMPTPNLEAIVAKILPALERVKGWAEGEQFLRLAEEANVHQSASDILRNSSLLQEEVAAGKLKVIKALYRLETGEVRRLVG